MCKRVMRALVHLRVTYVTDWAPIATLVFGYGAKSVQDWVQDRRKVQAEREVRIEARREKRAGQRDDLQRQTLLDLQQCVLDLARATAKAHLCDLEAFKKDGGKPWGSQQLSNDLSEELRIASANIALLRSRVRDATLRNLVESFSRECTVQGLAKSEAEVEQAKYRAVEFYKQVQDRAGQLIRNMDDISDPSAQAAP